MISENLIRDYNKIMSADNFELKQINGIPYYLDGTTSTIYTFELIAGQRSPESAAIGTFDAATGSIAYYPDWRERVQSNLQRFRESLFTQDRDKLRDTLVKPIKKSRKAARNPRKATSRTKNPKSESC
jgi:hypothetical protein